MGKTKIDPVAFLLAHITHLFMERHGMTVESFLDLDAEKDILGFVKAGYESFRSIGDEGILEEIDAYVGIIAINDKEDFPHPH